MTTPDDLFDADETSQDPSDLEQHIDEEPDENDYEEISSDEVDRVIQALDDLMTGVASENIRAYLEEAASNIYSLVYEDDLDYIEVDDPEDLAA